MLSKLFESETFLGNAIAGWASAPTQPDSQQRELAAFNWFVENYAFTMLLTLPFYTLSSYLAFKKLGVSYLGHFVLNAYITGQQTIIYSLSAILGVLTEKTDILSLVTLSISMFYALVVFWQFFATSSRVSILLRLLLTYVLSIGMFCVMTFMVVIVVS